MSSLVTTVNINTIPSSQISSFYISSILSFPMSLIPRVSVPVRTRLAGLAVTTPRSLFSSPTRLYSTPNSSFSTQAIHNVPHNPDHIQSKMPAKELLRNNYRFGEFDLEGRVYAITGGGRGLGLSMAEALIEAGAKGTYTLIPPFSK